MPRFITVNVQCDWAGCDAFGIEGEDTVVPTTVALDGKTEKEFLLCKAHRDDLDQILLPLMQAGVKVEKTKRSKRSSPSSTPADGNGTDETVGSIECLHQGCGRDDIKNKAGLAQHVIRSHGYKSYADYEAQHGVHID